MIGNYILESMGQSNIRKFNLTVVYQANTVQDEMKKKKIVVSLKR